MEQNWDRLMKIEMKLISGEKGEIKGIMIGLQMEKQEELTA